MHPRTDQSDDVALVRARATPRASHSASSDGQVSPGRSAGDHHAVGVSAVVGDVLLHPSEHPLGVDDVRRPGVARATRR